MHLVQGDLNLLSVRNIDFDADGVATLAGDLRGLIGGRIAVEVEDGDLGAVVRQASSDTEPDPRCATGDDGDLAAKVAASAG